MAKKKDPLNTDDPFKLNTLQSSAGVGPPAPKPAAEPPKVSTAAQFFRDSDTGKVNGVKLPDGREFHNLKAADIARIVEGYNGSSPVKVEKMAVQAEEQAAQKMLESTPVPDLISPETIAGVANPNPAIAEEMNARNETTASINTNLAQRERASKYTLGMIPGGPKPNDLTSALARITNRAVPGLGSSILTSLSAGNPKIAAYLEDYSNADNLASIRQEVGDAKEDIALSLDLVDVPETSDYAIDKFHKAVARLYRADAQLKILYVKDHKLNVLEDRQDIANYFKYRLQGDIIKLQDKLSTMNAVRR